MMDNTSTVEILRQARIFNTLSDQQLDRIAEICCVRDYQAGDILFEQGEVNSDLYIVLRGEVDIVVANDYENLDTKLTTLRRGQIFGEIALVDQGPRSATAVSGTMRTKVLSLPREELYNVCRYDPDLGFELMENLAKNLAHTIRQADAREVGWCGWMGY